jgi:hypothetical protein
VQRCIKSFTQQLKLVRALGGMPAAAPPGSAWWASSNRVTPMLAGDTARKYGA